MYCKHVRTPWSICSPTFFGVSWTGGCIFDVTSSGWVLSIYQRLCWQLIVLCTLGCIEGFYRSIGHPSRVSRVNLGGQYEYTIVILEEVGHDHSQTCLQEASLRLRDSYMFLKYNDKKSFAPSFRFAVFSAMSRPRSELVCSYAILCPSPVGHARISMQR